MKKKLENLLLLICLISATVGYSYGQPIPADPKVRIGKLSNGLTYYIRHNESPKNRADFYLAQKVGSVLEEHDQRGLAHFLEHMAFNGTKNFPGNTMVSELEKKGIRFGTNMNASTAFDQTIYKMNDIPVTRDGLIDTALLVLYDWSGFLTLDAEEIEKERGVVYEEWRTRSSSALRILDSGINPVIFAGSPYGNRMPIGSMDVIQHFKAKQLKDYYGKWYRPDLQGIIVVGDIDVNQVEAKIRAQFSGIQAAKNPAKREYFLVPGNKEPIVAIASDPELRDIRIDIYWKKDGYPRELKSDFSYYKTTLINTMIQSMLANRLFDVGDQTNLPYSTSGAGLSVFSSARTMQALHMNVSPIDAKHALPALQIILTEAERLRRFGFSPDELETCKKGMASLNIEPSRTSLNNTENARYVSAYIEAFMDNEPIITPEWKYSATKRLLTDISLEMVNKVAMELVTDTNMVMALQGPQNKNVQLPSKEQMLAVWTSVKNSQLDRYIHQAPKIYSLPEIKPKAGKIVKTKKNKPFGFQEWTLSNGVRVQYKQTEKPEDELILYGYSPGGYSAMKLEDLPSSKLIQNLTFQHDVYDPERQAKAHLRVSEYYESIAASAPDLKKARTMFLLTFLKMTAFKKDTIAFKKFMEGSRNAIRNKVKQPKDIFSDTLTSIMSNHNLRRNVSLQNPATLDKINYDKMAALFLERFNNARDFTFIMAGGMDVDSIRPLVETWLGGLPSVNRKETFTDHHMNSPKGKVRNHFTVPMKIPQSTVTIGYTGRIALSVQNQVLMQYLKGILKIIYNDRMREAEGGTYGAGLSWDISRFPKEHFIFQVYFDTDPAKKDKLISIVYDEINKIRAQGAPKEYLEKVKENLLKEFHQRSSEKNSEYWATQAWMLHVYGIDGRLDYEKIVSSINSKMVSEFAEKLFKQGNVIEVVMDPAKS